MLLDIRCVVHPRLQQLSGLVRVITLWKNKQLFYLVRGSYLDRVTAHGALK